jgi:hypothetical protein
MDLTILVFERAMCPNWEPPPPTQPGEEPLIGLPLFLPMGWKQSPPLFTATTETFADLTNAHLLANNGSSPHNLDIVSESPVKEITPIPTTVSGPESSPLPPLRHHPVHHHPGTVNNWDVYVDYFSGAVQGNSKHCRHVKRVLLESLKSLLRPLVTQDGPHRQEPASVKKMLQGDATLPTRWSWVGWLTLSICPSNCLSIGCLASLKSLN